MSRRNNIFIYVSDVASFIGQNKWDFVTPFERLWKKCDPDYDKLVRDLTNTIKEKNIENNELQNEKNNVKQKLIEKKITEKQYNTISNTIEKKQTVLKLEIDNKQEKLEDISLTSHQKLEKIVGTEIINKMSSVNIETNDKKKVLKNALDSVITDEKVLCEMKKKGESLVNTIQGTLYEDNAIKMYEEKFNLKLDVSQTFHKSLVFKSSAFNWYICGKVDGLYICEDDPTKTHIVEVKNRMKTFFNTIRDYEKTQIHLYMHMLGIARSKLVEKFKGKIRITDIYESNEYTEFVLERLVFFIEQFEKRFLNDINAKEKYILMDSMKKSNFIYSNFLQFPEESEESKNCDIS